LRYVLSGGETANAAIFQGLKWAAYLKDWEGPEPGERPTGYILILSDPGVAEKVRWDHGIAAQTIMLGAAAMGLGGCILGSVDFPGVLERLGVGDGLRGELCVALGHPAEEVRIEPLPDDGSIRYWRDEAGVHHVPKRGLDDLVAAKLED
jgi:nitroreductase